MATETSATSTAATGGTRRPVLTGIALAFGVAIVIALSTLIPSQFALSHTSPVLGTVSYVVQFSLLIAMAVGAVLVAAWSRTSALTAAIALVAIHVVANGISMALALTGAATLDEASGLGFFLWSALVVLGSSFSIATIAGAAAGGALLVTVLERRRRTPATSA